MKATYKQLLTYLSNRDRLQVVTNISNGIGEPEKAVVTRGVPNAREICIKIGDEDYWLYDESNFIQRVAVVIAPAWRTEVNLAGLTSTVPSAPAK